MDFTHDPNDFLSYIATVKREWTRASSNFLGLVEHWQDLSMNNFAGISSVAAKEHSVEGEVLGKQFTIDLSPISQDRTGLAEAVLFLRQIGGSKSELGRFRIRRDGAILSTGGETLLEPEDNHYSYRIFTTVLRAVVEAPAPTDTKKTELT